MLLCGLISISKHTLCAAAAYDRELEIVPIAKTLSPSLPATLNLIRQLCKAEGKVLRSYDAAFLFRLASK